MTSLVEIMDEFIQKVDTFYQDMDITDEDLGLLDDLEGLKAQAAKYDLAMKCCKKLKGIVSNQRILKENFYKLLREYPSFDGRERLSPADEKDLHSYYVRGHIVQGLCLDKATMSKHDRMEILRMTYIYREMEIHQKFKDHMLRIICRDF